MKKILFILIILTGCVKTPTYQTNPIKTGSRSATISLLRTNIGTIPNDGTGDPLRTFAQKQNTNADAIEAFAATVPTTSEVTEEVNDSLDQLRSDAIPIGDIFGDLLYNQTKILNALDYGAVGDGVTDDTDELQAWLNAGISSSEGVGGLYLPAGTYLISDTLTIKGILWENASPMIFGDGNTSIILNDASTPAFKFEDVWKPQMRDLTIMGDGGEFGAGATTGYALILDHSGYGIFDNLFIHRNGGGVYMLNESNANKFINCTFRDNLNDGLNILTRSTDENSGENGNATSIINCNINANGNDGIEYSSSQLNIEGCTIEFNKGSGVQLGSKNSTSGIYGVNISGNSIEGNDSSQIKIYTYETLSRYAVGITIQGNYISGTNTVGDVSSITQTVVGTFANSLSNFKVINNHSYRGVFVTKYVVLATPSPDCIIENHWVTTDENTIPTGMVAYGGALNAIPRDTWLDADGITAGSLLSPVMYLVPDGAIDITANPQIRDGIFDGQVIMLINASGTNTVTLDDGNGLNLSAQFVMGAMDVITLMYDLTNDVWIEISRSNN